MSEQESWEPGDVVRANDGSLWCRAGRHDIDAGWPWAYCPSYIPKCGRFNIPEGGVEESYPVRPLLLVFRDGQVYSGITNGTGDQVPDWVSRASAAALESQLVDVAAEHRALRAGLRVLHRRVETGPESGHCDACGTSYPCNTVLVLDAQRMMQLSDER